MRLIDFHTHPYRPSDLNPATWQFIRSISPTIQQHGDKLSDPRYFADLLLGDGVAHAVVLPEHCLETSGNVRTETVLEICSAVPEVLIAFASVHPLLDREPGDLLSSYIEQGVRGLKLYPSYQFYYPNDRAVYPL